MRVFGCMDKSDICHHFHDVLNCFDLCIADDFVVLEFNSHKSGLSQ